MRVLAIDPGNVESAYLMTAFDSLRPARFGKVPNEILLEDIAQFGAASATVGIEMIASYGMPVGKEVFDTCVWVGRFVERLYLAGVAVELIPRGDVKVHLCHSARAKDANVTQALVDRFAPGAPNKGKGTKARPGWFHGFSGDVWAAYALAVYLADTTPAAVAS